MKCSRDRSKLAVQFGQHLRLPAFRVARLAAIADAIAANQHHLCIGARTHHLGQRARER